MRRFLSLAVLLGLILLAVQVLTGCYSGVTARLKIITSTSLIECIIEQVGGDRVEAINLVPPNQHPGNFDVRPGDIRKLSNANLFLLHGWPGEGYADKLISSANNPKLKVVKTEVDGNWMIPSVQLTATGKITGILSDVDSQNAAAYQKSAEAYQKVVRGTEANIRDRLTGSDVSKVKVVASTRQVDFLQWAGFQVVDTYASPQALTPQVVKDLIDNGKANGVVLVINNLQDGPDAGKAIAQELGAMNLNLSNFPGGFDNTETWEKAINHNIDILLNALEK